MGYFRPLSQTKFINDANLVRYYPFDGNSTDAKSGNNGTDTSVSYSSSYAVNSNFVQGVNFTGSGSHIIANNTSLPTGASAFTTVFWFKTSTAGTQAFYGYGTAAANGYRNSVMIVSNKFYFSGFGADLDSGFTVNDGVIHQGVVTYSGTTMKIFVDGVLKNSGAVTLNVQSGTSFYLGENSQTDTFYTGDMDDFAMFSRALSAGEVAELYQSQTLGEYLGAGSGTTKLLLHLNGSSADSSGNNNNGIDTNITYSQANGKFGQGAGFNSGNTSYITLPNLSTGTGDFTLSLWINTTTYGTNKRYYISQQNSGAPYNTFQLNYASPNLYFGHYDGSTDLNLNIPTLPSTGAWYNIIFTKNGNTGSVYVNGSLAVSGTGWSSRNCGEAHYNGLGLSGSNSFYGAMDEVIKELGVAWSAEKVKKYYTYNKGRFGII